jgi:hypothetical protein
MTFAAMVHRQYSKIAPAAKHGVYLLGGGAIEEDGEIMENRISRYANRQMAIIRGQIGGGALKLKHA